MDLESRFRVRPGELRFADLDPADKSGLTRDSAGKLQARNVERLDDLQERLYAEGSRALLVIVQAMEAAGKTTSATPIRSPPERRSARRALEQVLEHLGAAGRRQADAGVGGPVVQMEDV